MHFEGAEGNIQHIFHENYNKGRRLLAGIENYDAYTDYINSETYMSFEQLDQEYPESKFILNTRDLSSWLSSRERHVKRNPDLQRLQLENPDNPWYNCDIEFWEQQYRTLHNQAHKYFKKRPDDLLVMNVTGGDGWEKLCPFLNMPLPGRPFPARNKATSFRS